MAETSLPNESRLETMSRRDFLGVSWRVLAAFLAGQGACMGLRFLASRQAEGDFGEIVSAGIVDDFPLGTITPFETAKFFLVRFEDGGFLALYSTCTHLACTVNWDANRERFVCPCHGSEFDRLGGVINPPAPTPLNRFAVAIDDSGRVTVDTRTPITRTDTRGDVLVYAPSPPPASTPAPLRLPGGHELEP